MPMVLVDNGSTLNVCSLKVASCLGLEISDFTPSDQIVRAYDNTKRDVFGVATLDLEMGSTSFKVPFQVIHVPAYFNLLLGRP